MAAMTPRLIGMTGKVRGANVEISERLTLGSAPESTLRIPSRAVSKIHARILKIEGQYYVEDAGSRNGTFLNGQRVKRFPIRHLDVLTLAPDVDLIFMETGAAAPVIPLPASLNGQFLWLDGPLKGQTQGFAAGRRLILGRSVELPLEAISRRHAALTITDESATVEDLDSANGTWVNGVRISQVTVLSDGDEVSLGSVITGRVSLFSRAPGSVTEIAETNSPTVVVDQPAKRQKYGEPVLDVFGERPVATPGPTPAPPSRQVDAPAPRPAAVDQPPIPDPTVVVPRAPVSLPAALRGSPERPEVRRPGGDTAKAPPTPAVAPPLAKPSTQVPSTVKPPREPAGGVPSELASRARAAREAVDVTMAAPTPPSPPTTPSPPPAAQDAAAANAPSDVATTPIKGARFEGVQTLALPRGSFIIGRQKDSPVFIDLRDVGRKHAKLTIGESAVTVEDLGSANGTFVDDVRVSGEVVVRDGSRVRFATVEFTVIYLPTEG